MRIYNPTRDRLHLMTQWLSGATASGLWFKIPIIIHSYILSNGLNWRPQIIACVSLLDEMRNQRSSKQYNCVHKQIDSGGISTLHISALEDTSIAFLFVGNHFIRILCRYIAECCRYRRSEQLY